MVEISEDLYFRWVNSRTVNRMQRCVKYLILVVLFASFLATVPIFPSAETDSASLESSYVIAGDDNKIKLLVIIDRAYYDDFDDDGEEDDVIIEYRIFVLDYSDYDDDWGYERTYHIWAYTTLTLPSGLRYTYFFDFATVEGVEITQVWIDGAQEEGWYKFSIYTDGYDDNVKGDYERIVFDPPGGGLPGPPSIVMKIVQL